ncbi:MAG: helix-hairpin-helix domain-containing protein [Ferruginibacter sp.]
MMRRSFLMFCLAFLLPVLAWSQVPDQPASTTTEQQLENITENSEDLETEDDSYLQQMAQFQKNPLNLNTAGATALKDLIVLSPIQIQNLISYRELFGKFISIYELQAVPGWDARIIQKILPYVSVADPVNIVSTFSDRLKGGEHSSAGKGFADC